MGTREAINRIKDHMDVHRMREYNAVKIIEALEMSIEALEKQVPRHPTDVYEVTFDPFPVGMCPVCREGVNGSMQYCDACGQKLWWW